MKPGFFGRNKKTGSDIGASETAAYDKALLELYIRLHFQPVECASLEDRRFDLLPASSSKHVLRAPTSRKERKRFAGREESERPAAAPRPAPPPPYAPGLSHDAAPPARQDEENGLFSAREEDEPCLCECASIEDALNGLEDGFTATLLRLIDTKGMTDAECYKKAFIDRRLFSKIRGDPDYKPGKKTVLAFALALELTLDETRLLLMKAGYALSNANKGDVIVSFFIEHGIYSIIAVNEALYEYDQELI